MDLSDLGVSNAYFWKCVDDSVMQTFDMYSKKGETFLKNIFITSTVSLTTGVKTSIHVYVYVYLKL